MSFRQSFLLFLLCSIMGTWVSYQQAPERLSLVRMDPDDYTLMNHLGRRPIAELALNRDLPFFTYGQYAVMGIGGLFYRLFFHASDFPFEKVTAVCSYVFLGILWALPLLLLRRRLQTPFLLMIVVLNYLAPISEYQDTLAGTIHHLKYPFFYFGLLALMTRRLYRDKMWIVLTSDLALALAVNSNQALYLLALVVIAEELMKFSKDYNLWSVLLLLLLITPQAIWIWHKGIQIPFYFADPFKWNATIPLFCGRNFVFPFFAKFYTHFSDVSAAIVTLLVFFWVGLVASKKNIDFYALTLWALFSGVFGVIIARPGLSHFLGYYNRQYYAFYLYPQTLVFYLLFATLCQDTLAHLRKMKAHSYFRLLKKVTAR